jgi:hypothetical protein
MSADSKLKVVKFGRKAPEGMAQYLRDMADRVDRGEVTDMVAMFISNDNYEECFDASLIDCIAMTAMLHHRAVERMRK